MVKMIMSHKAILGISYLPPVQVNHGRVIERFPYLELIIIISMAKLPGKIFSG
jgi:hypothetical protein